jgi:hypothetical protein
MRSLASNLGEVMGRNTAIASTPKSVASETAGGGGNGGKKMRNSAPPTIKLNQPQMTLTSADDSPTPRGVANGVWNLLPQMPCTKCGTPLARKAPAKKCAR